MKLIWGFLFLLGSFSAMAQATDGQIWLDDIGKGSTITFKQDLLIPANEYAITIKNTDHDRWTFKCNIFFSETRNYERKIPRGYEIKTESISGKYKIGFGEEKKITAMFCSMELTARGNFSPYHKMTISEFKEAFKDFLELKVSQKKIISIADDY